MSSLLFCRNKDDKITSQDLKVNQLMLDNMSVLSPARSFMQINIIRYSGCNYELKLVKGLLDCPELLGDIDCASRSNSFPFMATGRILLRPRYYTLLV